MSTDYSLWINSPTGTPLALVDRYIRLQYVMTVNTVGVARLDLSDSFDLSLIQEDSQLEIWRKVQGGRKYLEGETSWLIRDWEEGVTARGEATTSLLAYTSNEILDRAIIDYPAGSSQSNKTGLLDNVMKALVRENLGSLATNTARNLGEYLAVEGDLGQGPSTTKTAAWRKLLPTLRELAQESDDQGQPIFFDVISNLTTAIGWVFRTYLGQRGSDHGSGSAKPVTLSTRSGTLGELKYMRSTLNERNAITIGGANRGEDRIILRVTDDGRISISPINRREKFVDARNSEASSMMAEARTALKSNRPRDILTGKIRSTRAVEYGRDYYFGDRLQVESRQKISDARLDSVQVTVERGKEDIRGDLRVEA